MDPSSDLAALARRATAGDRLALSELCRRLQGPIYRLALQMLWHPADAEDAAQEILIKVVTHLGSFEGRSALTTWVYQIGVRHLLRVKAGRIERTPTSAPEYAELIDEGIRAAAGPAEDAELRLLAREVRVGCVNGMLQCLSRIERVAYVLSEVLGLDDPTGAQICEVEPATYRQRLSRARATMDFILKDRCGLVAQSSPCRCSHQAGVKKAIGLHQKALLFASDDEHTQRALEELTALGRAGALFRDVSPQPRARLWERLRAACPELLG